MSTKEGKDEHVGRVVLPLVVIVWFTLVWFTLPLADANADSSCRDERLHSYEHDDARSV